MKIHLITVKFTTNISQGFLMCIFLIHADIENMPKNVLVSAKGAQVSNSPCH